MAIEINDRVKIKYCSNYRGRLTGMTGTVKSNYFGSIAVAVDDAYNGSSSYGWYYFSSNQLEKITEEGTTKMEGKFRVALVKFIEGTNTDKAYEYACYDSSIEVNDCVVVKSAHHGLGIGVVSNFTENVGQDIIREIVCKADFSAYKARIAARKRRDEIRKQMARRAAQMQEIAMYKLLAAEDAEMATLVKEYSELSDGN